MTTSATASARSRASHLSREGVALARQVGATLGSYDLVVTSWLPRAIETAIAMGYGVDRDEYMLATMMLADREVDLTLGFSAYAAAAKAGGITYRACQLHADILRSIAAELPPDGRALVVSHGGVLELGVVGLLPDLDYSAWGPTLRALRRHSHVLRRRPLHQRRDSAYRRAASGNVSVPSSLPET